MRKNLGAAIDTPESLTNVLVEEKGEVIYYNSFPETYNQNIKLRHINNDIRYLNGGIFKAPNRFIYSIHKGHIISSNGLIYDKSSRSFIDESAKEWILNIKKTAVANSLAMPTLRYLNGITLSCLSTGAEGGFYHFMHEVLPKLFFCKDLLPHINQILVAGPPVDWKIKWFDHIGINSQQIEWTSHPIHYCCNQLIFTNRLISDQQISSWSLNALKELIYSTDTNYNDTPSEIIWLTRTNTIQRIISWEDEVLSSFPNIKKVDLLTLSTKDTIALFKTSTHVIAAHGAGLSNIFLCNKGTKILEIYPNSHTYQPCYFRISSLCKLIHRIVVVNFTDKNDPVHGLNSFKKILKSFLNDNNI